MTKQKMSARFLEQLVMARAMNERGCEDLTGVTVGRADGAAYGRNWNVTHIANETSSLGAQVISRIAEHLGREYDLRDDDDDSHLIT